MKESTQGMLLGVAAVLTGLLVLACAHELLPFLYAPAPAPIRAAEAPEAPVEEVALLPELEDE